MQFVPFEQGIEVNGQTVFSVVDGFDLFAKSAHQILGRHKIGTRRMDGTQEIDPEGWYPQSAWLKAFEEIASTRHRLSAMGSVNLLFRIGMAIPRNAVFPASVRDIRTAIQSIDVAYHMNHRKGGRVMFDESSGELLDGIGEYGYREGEAENEIISNCRNPYPCDFDLGILTAMATKFEPDAQVVHDPHHTCRKRGDDECCYRIIW